MEKMFVYPETLESRVLVAVSGEELENRHSRADVASHRCKLYRTLLEQRTASQKAWRPRLEREQRATGAYA
jgi:hypothetical protein